jgi:hypothetical protein
VRSLLVLLLTAGTAVAAPIPVAAAAPAAHPGADPSHGGKSGRDDAVNHPPALDLPENPIIGHTNEDLDLEITVHDIDGDDLALTMQGLPPSASLKQGSIEHDDDGGSHLDAQVEWVPGDSQYGVYDVTFTASDGKSQVTAVSHVEINEEWESWLLPGLQYSAYFPVASSVYGQFQGASAEFVLFSWSHRNENRGPSHGRIYANFDLLKSNKTGVSVAASYTMGFDLSIERNPHRQWLIPYFGLEAGGLSVPQAPAALTAEPLAGVHLWVGRNLFVNLSGGYLFPSRDLDQLRGWRIKLGVDFSLW